MRCPACGKELSSIELKKRQCAKCNFKLPVVGAPGAQKALEQAKQLPDLPWKKKGGVYRDDALPPPQRTKVVPIDEVDAMEGKDAFKAGEIEVTPPPVPMDAPMEKGGIVTDAPMEAASIEDRRLIGAAPPPPPRAAAGPASPSPPPPPASGMKNQAVQQPVSAAPPAPPPPSPSPAAPHARGVHRGEPTIRVAPLPPPPPPPNIWARYGSIILVMVAFVAVVMVIAGILLMASG